MLISLALAASLAQGEIVAQRYTIRLTGPMYTAFVHFLDDYSGETQRRAMGPRDIEVTIADGRLRCDTAKLVSVIKSSSEYIFIDHRSKEALVLRGEKGKSAACATTPFWPEAHGDATSLDALREKSKSGAAMLSIGFSGKDTDWLYVPGNPHEYRELRKSGTCIYYGLSSEVGVAIPNNTYHCDDNSKPGTFEVMWRATHSYAPGEKLPVAVTVADESFSVPSGYAVFVDEGSASHRGAKVLDSEGVSRFVNRFPIPTVLPRTLLPG